MPQNKPSKHKRRRLRREQYHRFLEGAIEDPRSFVQRVISAMDHHGFDIAPDGRPIKADFWRFIRSRLEEAQRNGDGAVQRRLAGSAMACEEAIRRAVKRIAVKPLR